APPAVYSGLGDSRHRPVCRSRSILVKRIWLAWPGRRQSEQVVVGRSLAWWYGPILPAVVHRPGLCEQIAPLHGLGGPGELATHDRVAVVAGRPFESRCCVHAGGARRGHPVARVPLRVGLDGGDAAAIQVLADRAEQTDGDGLAIPGVRDDLEAGDDPRCGRVRKVGIAFADGERPWVRRKGPE